MSEIVKAESRVPVSFGVPLRSLDEAYRLSQNLAIAAMLPSSLRGKPADVLAILLYGQELGLGPMQSIQSIYVVNGRPSLSAQTWRALVRRAGHKVRMVERVSGVSATVEIVRADDEANPHRETYTMDMAKAAKLSEKDVWRQHTDDMLAARATARACRFVCPEVALGFYTEDEIEDAAAVPVADDVADAEVIPDDKSDADVAAEVASLQSEFGEGWPPAEDMADADA